MEKLPAELLESIHLHSLSAALPSLNRGLHAIFSETTTNHRARFLLLSHPQNTLHRALKHPITDLAVLHALERLCAKSKQILKTKELPRRLLSATPIDIPLIHYLLDHYSVSPNSKKGYFLSKAVFIENLPLVQLLLDYGADPTLNGNWSVRNAIAKGDLQLVRMLLEGDYVHPQLADDAARTLDDVEVDRNLVGKRTKRRISMESEGSTPRKKVKLGERCKATGEMLEVAVSRAEWRIVDYLRARGEFAPFVRRFLDSNESVRRCAPDARRIGSSVVI